MSDTSEKVEKVRRALADYEHPLLEFSAHEAGEGAEVHITLTHPVEGIEPYVFSVHPREIDHSQFIWTFQSQLYNCLHDYLIEMFTRNPQLQDY